MSAMNDVHDDYTKTNILCCFHTKFHWNIYEFFGVSIYPEVVSVVRLGG